VLDRCRFTLICDAVFSADNSVMAYGVCKLTGKSGKFVKSHLLPKALTRPGVAGEYFISGGQGCRPKKRWTSWYDQELVIKKGEDILANYDN
jgi:hypothetical protein